MDPTTPGAPHPPKTKSAYSERFLARYAERLAKLGFTEPPDPDTLIGVFMDMVTKEFKQMHTRLERLEQRVSKTRYSK